jgi:hypothetical protein
LKLNKVEGFKDDLTFVVMVVLLGMAGMAIKTDEMELAVREKKRCWLWNLGEVVDQT